MPGPDVNALCGEVQLFEDGVVTTGWSGRLITRFEVTKIQDVRSLKSAAAYQVQCIARIRIFPTSPFAMQVSKTQWSDYPAALLNLIDPTIDKTTTDPDSKISPTIELADYSPKTVNTSVNQDVGRVLTGDDNLTRQFTSGSAMTTTNSFGFNIGVDAEERPPPARISNIRRWSKAGASE